MSLNLKNVLTLLALVLLPTLISGVLIYQNARETIIANQLAALEAIADTKVKSIEDFASSSLLNFGHLRNSPLLANSLVDIVALAQQPQRPEYLSSISTLGKHFPALRRDFGLKSIALLDRSSKLVYQSDLPQGQGLSQKQYSDFIEDLLKRKGPIAPYVNFFHCVNDHTSGILVVGPIRDDDTSAGFMALEIEWEKVDAIFHDNTGLGETGKSVLGKWVGQNHFVHLTSSLRIQPHLDKTLVEFGPRDKPLPMQRAVSGENGSGLMQNFLGTRTFAAWRYLPEFDLGLVAKMNADEAFKSMTVLKVTTTTILLITTTIGVILVLLLASLPPFGRKKRSISHNKSDGDLK